MENEERDNLSPKWSNMKHVHIIMAVLFGIGCGILTTVSMDFYVKGGSLLALLVMLTGFVLAFNFTMNPTIPVGFMLTKSSIFVSKFHVLFGWFIPTVIGIWFIALPAVRGD